MARFTFTIHAGSYGVVRMAAAHAPAGGISIGGKEFKGGEFIPGEVVERATAEEKAKLNGDDKGNGDAARKRKESPRVTDSKEFKKWFGESEVVDKDGQPLMVFHGTGDDFEIFSQGASGRDSTSDSKKGFFFTTNANQASEFAFKDGDFKGIIKPVYLKSERLLRVEVNSDVYDPRINNNAIKKAKDEGWDGIVFIGQSDPWGNVGDNYMVFEPTQIKSATGNKGTFDPSNPDIRMSSTRR